MKTLETRRLRLRKWLITDLEDFYEYSKNPKVGPMAGWKPHSNMEESKAILNAFLEKEEVWAMVYKEYNKVIGSIGLHKDPKRDIPNAKMIGYALAEEYWGYGLATEAAKELIRYAFEELQLDLISVYHYSFNYQSERVIEKCGFQYEGTLRMASQIFNGRIYDDVCYSLKREEWRYYQ